jgi:hypothetical protein
MLIHDKSKDMTETWFIREKVFRWQDTKKKVSRWKKNNMKGAFVICCKGRIDGTIVCHIPLLQPRFVLDPLLHLLRPCPSVAPIASLPPPRRLVPSGLTTACEPPLCLDNYRSGALVATLHHPPCHCTLPPDLSDIAALFLYHGHFHCHPNPSPLTS